MTRVPRVFIGLREVAGVGRSLKAGFDEIGVECAFLNIGYHPHKYEARNNPPWADRLGRASQRLGRHFTGAWWKRILWIGFVQNLFSVLAFPRALLRYDAFVYISVGSFFFFFDLPLLKLFGKKIVFVFLGSDSRPVYLNGYVVSSTGRGAMWKAVVLARTQKTIVWLIDRFADVVVNMPPQAHFHTRPYASLLHVGLPVVAPPPDPGAAASPPPRPRILHAPSKTGPKGTDRIRAMIAALRSRGLDFDYVEVTGRPHAEVLEEIARSSFVVDELYSDTPMAVFASEAASFGRTAVIGSYYHAQVAAVLAPGDVPPTVFCHPDEVERSIERLLAERTLREDLGQRARAFVTGPWSAAAVAKRYLRLIEGDVPPEWMLDPRDIRYVEGTGLTAGRGAQVLHAFLATGGRSALCVGDKPELEKLLLARAAQALP